MKSDFFKKTFVNKKQLSSKQGGGAETLHACGSTAWCEPSLSGEEESSYLHSRNLCGICLVTWVSPRLSSLSSSSFSLCVSWGQQAWERCSQLHEVVEASPRDVPACSESRGQHGAQMCVLPMCFACCLPTAAIMVWGTWWQSPSGDVQWRWLRTLQRKSKGHHLVWLPEQSSLF